MTIKLSCTCGAVQGVAIDATPDSGTRVVCCCDDCQAFANHLDCKTAILDEFGGTEIYQSSMSQVRIDHGAEHLRCLRLSAKGIRRWYTDCCNTPIGNTMTAGFPFIGLIHNFVNNEVDRDSVLGPVRAYVQVRHALGTPTYPHSAQKFPPGITFRIMRKMLVWKLRGRNKPSAFFDDNGQPVSEPMIIT